MFQSDWVLIIGFHIMCPSVWIISAHPAAVSRPFSHAETMEVSMRIVPLWVHTRRSARSTQNETLSVINFNSTSGDFQGQLLPVNQHTGHSSLKQQRCAHLDTSGGRCEEFHGVFYFWCEDSIHFSIDKSVCKKNKIRILWHNYTKKGTTVQHTNKMEQDKRSKSLLQPTNMSPVSNQQHTLPRKNKRQLYIYIICILWYIYMYILHIQQQIRSNKQEHGHFALSTAAFFW